MTFKLDFNYITKIYTILGEDSKKIPWMVLLFLILSILDIMGIGLIAPYMVMIINPDLFMKSDIGLYLHSIFYFKLSDMLFLVGCFLVLIFLTKAIIGICVNYMILKFCHRQSYKIRSLLMSKYQSMKYEDYIKRNSSEYIHNIQVVADKFSIGVLQAILRVASESLVIITILLFLAWSSIEIVLLLSTLLGSVVLLYDLLFGKKMKIYGELSNRHSTLMVQGIHEGIDGFKEIRVLGRESYFYKTVSNEAKEYSGKTLKSGHISLMPRYLLELTLVLFIVLLVNIFLFLDKDSSYLLSMLSMFGIAAVRLIPSVNRVMSGISMIRYGRNFVDIIYKDIERRVLRDGSGALSHKQGKRPAFNLLQLDNVTFTYSGASNCTINDVSFKIMAGESIGIIGTSGSGKTTLIDLIIGLLHPSNGRILVNGNSIDKDISGWMTCIAYIPQQIFLIDDSLERNIALGEVGDIDKNRMSAAIKQSRLEGVIDGLKYGIKTVIGERGVQLSGGQRQRVALARAFYYGRDVLIMDEATSALDNETEHEVVSEIKRLKGVKTTIVIAHRLTTLQHCDRIYRLEKGQILERLNYDDIA